MNLWPGGGSRSLLCPVQEELRVYHIIVTQISHSYGLFVRYHLISLHF